MTDNSNPDGTPTASPLTARVWLWHTFPDGTATKVEIPVVAHPNRYGDINTDELKQGLDRLYDAGFTANAPGVKAGQHVEEVGSLVIGETAGKGTVDGKLNTAYCVVYYSTRDELIYRAYGKHYLNNDEDVALFEATTGIKPSQATNKWGWSQKKGAAPMRNDPDAAKYFYRIKTPIRVAFVVNPDYNPDETEVSKKKSQYEFDGYVGSVVPNANSKPQTAVGQPSGQPASSQDAGDQSALNNAPAQPKGKLDTAVLLAQTGGLFSADDHAFNAFGKLTKAGTLNGRLSLADQLAVIQADRLKSWGEKEATKTLYVINAYDARDLTVNTTIRWRKLVLKAESSNDGHVAFSTVDPDGLTGRMSLPITALLIAQDADVPF